MVLFFFGQIFDISLVFLIFGIKMLWTKRFKMVVSKKIFFVNDFVSHRGKIKNSQLVLVIPFCIGKINKIAN